MTYNVFGGTLNLAQACTSRGQTGNMVKFSGMVFKICK